MTEQEWLTSEEPQTLLEFARSRISARKCRLLASAFCRYTLPLVSYECGQRAVEVAEQYADGLSTFDSMLAASKTAGDAYVNFGTEDTVNTDLPLSAKAESIALQATMFVSSSFDHYLDTCCQCTWLATLRWALLRAGPDEKVAPYGSLIRWQLSLIPEVIGNPFRPMTVDPSWVTSDVVALAEGIYHDKAFDRLPILGDALMDAGCDNEDILTHCRSEGPHVRGCWAIDLLTGRM